MRVGDSRRPLRYLLHCVRSCDISFSWMYSQPVHSSMSCIHCLLGLRWCRSPSMIPSRTVSANCPALPRIIWPKYCSFSFATLPINCLSRPNSVNIESFVRCSCHEMLSSFLQHHISKASILFQAYVSFKKIEYVGLRYVSSSFDSSLSRPTCLSVRPSSYLSVTLV